QILGDAGYRFMGDPSGVNFNNRRRLSAGLGFVANRLTWRLLAENLTPLLDTVPWFDAAGLPIGFREVQDHRLARLDLTLRSLPGGTTRIGLTKGFNDSTEEYGFVLEFSTGGR
ncbi:MAG TPA: hypothetical protein VFT43_08530, partial [Candidatus Polarisedimenticolia bacterium]|nr:hypothetical protein [Candidatus Polarisedimenticolia bacterium]